MSDNGSRLLRNVRPGMVILDDLGAWQKVMRVETAGRYTTLWLEDGSDEEGPSGDRVQAREPAPAPDAHVSYVPGEDPGTAALREMVNDNRELLGIDADGGGEEL